jgi:hypothetical protein
MYLTFMALLVPTFSLAMFAIAVVRIAPHVGNPHLLHEQPNS